ncbi:MAG: DtxR family transcriptional regulator [Desulfobulbus propionicus]|nr:MAG: DtxR family transcriptional regulator [Desulfobulbus propionicus]
MSTNQRLSASLEDYIEAIYHIIEEKKVARGKDISARLNVSGPSVTEALRALSQRGLINYVPYEVITMTDEGRVVAEDVISRHDALKQFFVDVLAMDMEVAEEGACKIEHTAPREIINRIVQFTHFLEICPRGGKELIAGFADYCTKGETRTTCAECISQCIGIKDTNNSAS